MWPLVWLQTPSLQLGVLQSYRGSPIHILPLHVPSPTPSSTNDFGSRYYKCHFSLRHQNLPLTPILAYARCNKGWPLTLTPSFIVAAKREAAAIKDYWVFKPYTIKQWGPNNIPQRFLANAQGEGHHNPERGYDAWSQDNHTIPVEFNSEHLAWVEIWRNQHDDCWNTFRIAANDLQLSIPLSLKPRRITKYPKGVGQWGIRRRTNWHIYGITRSTAANTIITTANTTKPDEWHPQENCDASQ